MKFTFFLMLSAFILTLVCGVCPPVAADIWTSGKVVYTTDAYGDKDIAVMGPNGEHLADLTDSADDEYNPTWSPDGTEILYVREVFPDEPEVWLMDADGSNERPILFGLDPSWAPDGERFVARDYDRETLGIYTLDAWHEDWDDVDVIVNRGHPKMPAWSPDGDYIAYVAGSPGSLYVYDVAARRSRRIVRGSSSYSLSYPTWGPQSNHILFSWGNARFGDGAHGIFSVRPDGSDLDIHNWWEDYALYHPTVAPYGGELIFSRDDLYTDERYLYKVTRRTNNWQRLDPDSGTFNDDADWWHPSSFPVEPGASQLTTTWGDLKKKGR